jgi:hypothetical protein
MTNQPRPIRRPWIWPDRPANIVNVARPPGSATHSPWSGVHPAPVEEGELSCQRNRRR